MSFWTPEELDALDYVEITTTQGKTQVTVRSPGIVEVTGDGIPRKWEVREGFGISGSTQVYRGTGLAEFDISLELWEFEHRGEFTLWSSTIAASPPGKPERVFKIKYPTLALLGITQCVFLNDPLVIPDKPKGSVIVAYNCRQWRKGVGTLTSPTSAAGETPAGAAKDAFEARIAERAAVLENLLGAP